MKEVSGGGWRTPSRNVWVTGHTYIEGGVPNGVELSPRGPPYGGPSVVTWIGPTGEERWSVDSGPRMERPWIPLPRL